MPRTKKQRNQKPRPLPIVPLKYAGRWIAWDYNHTRIVASGTTLAEAQAKAQTVGEARAWFDRAPDAEVRFGGARN